MMSISINKKDDAPTRISDAGYEEALSDTNYIKLAAELATLQATLCAAHGSIAAASRASDANFEVYRSLYSRCLGLKKSLLQKKFKQEYRDFFSKAQCP
jgi:hypothetical protein